MFRVCVFLVRSLNTVSVVTVANYGGRDRRGGNGRRNGSGGT